MAWGKELEKYGELIAGYCVSVREGDEVNILAGLAAIDGVREVYRSVVKRGGYPRVILTDDYLMEIFYRYAPERLLLYESKVDEYMMENVDVLIRIISPVHSKPLIGVNPERFAKRERATRRLSEIFHRRESEGKLRWVATVFPSPASAQEAGMGPLEWEEFVARALKLHEDDPVKAWERQSAFQNKIVELLSRAKELRVVGPGTDLTLAVEGRVWINDDGKNNMPGGEVFTGPHEDSVEGRILFDVPSLWRGYEVRGVRLTFRNGEVVEAEAEVGRELLLRVLQVDEGARRVGEFSFGLNYDISRPSKLILFDEKIGGTIHLALGSAYTRTGGKNISSIHWDLIKDMREGKVYADGELIYANGRFLGL